ncbi:MAG: fibronectin type III domain-containing protein, partial [Brevefilum sp.]|nr:fibronectin type III domain-containing protein [Brevefilum sp.]
YSANSNIDSAITFATLPAPTGLSATAVSTTQIDLAWTDNAADESAYRVERSLTGTGGWTQIADLPADSTAVSNTSLTPGTTYFYRVRAYRAADGAYSAYSDTASATTPKENAEVTLHDLSQVYDGSQKPVSATTVPSGLAVVITYDGELTPPTDAGEYAVVAAIEDDQYQGSTGGTLVVSPKPITVTADAQSKVYGDNDPDLTYEVYPALVSGDSFSGALSREPGENVGGYPILQNTLSAGSNYTITYVPANLAITTRPIEVTADDKSKTVGDNDPALTYQVTDGSLAFTDQFTGSLIRDPGEDIGTYPILQGTLALNANYDLSFVPGTFTITALPTVQVTVDEGQSKVYGENDPVFAYTASDPTVEFTGALSRVKGENVGAYTITIGTLTAEGYQINLVTANFSITPKPITVTADNQSKTVGDDDPLLTYHITSGGLAFDDQFIGSLEREPGEDVGTYAILQGTLALNANYTLTFIPGDFVINPSEGFTIFFPLITR